MMAERAITFSMPMIPPILAGTKIQTRRVLKPQPYSFENCGNKYWNASGCVGGRICVSDDDLLALHPWKVGDILWVREGWRTLQKWDCLKPSHLADDIDHVKYEGGPDRNPLWAWGRYRSAGFMPRWASRISLRVTAVRVERLQDISEADALAEGIRSWVYDDCDGDPRIDGALMKARGFHAAPETLTGPDGGFGSAVRAFSDLWGCLHGADAWDANPFVVVVSFERIE
jgi:hypothetical protein